MSTASGPTAGSGCATWPAAASGRRVTAPRPRCAQGVGVCTDLSGTSPCASLLRRAPNCGIEGTLDRVKYKEGGRKKGDIERLGERKDNCPALGLSAGPWGQDRKKEPRCLEHKGGCKGIRVNLRVPKNVQARVTGVTFGGQPGSESVESTVEERDQY